MTPPSSSIPEDVRIPPILYPTEKRAFGAARQAYVLGVPFHCITQAQCLQTIERFVQERLPRQICLANAYTVALAQRDTILNALLKKAALVLADGMSIVWGGHWIGVQLPQRVPGPDLMEAVCRRASRNGHRIFLMGSSQGTLQKLQEKLLRLCPGLQIAGAYSPPMCDHLGEDANQIILGLLEAARPDILFVGMSCPKQEKWIAENLHRLPVPVSLGVGAAFDFLSGNIPRAPHWIRRIGLEWLYRLYREPRRLWRRYLLGNIIFLAALAKASMHRSRIGPSPKT